MKFSTVSLKRKFGGEDQRIFPEISVEKEPDEEDSSMREIVRFYGRGAND